MPLSKGVTNLLPKNKILLFNQQNVFKPKIFGSVLFKKLWFLLWSQISFKINLAFKKMVCNWFIKQNPCKKFCSQLLKTLLLAKPKWVFTNLVSKVLFWKRVSENKVWLQKLYLSKWEKKFKSFSKLVLFDSNKRGATLCLKNKLCFQNHLIWNHSKKEGVCLFRK